MSIPIELPQRDNSNKKENNGLFRNEIITNHPSISPETFDYVARQIALLHTHWFTENTKQTEESLNETYIYCLKQIREELKVDEPFGVVFSYENYNNNLAGFGFLQGCKAVYGPETATYGYGYVFPQYRNQGVFGRITTDICTTAKALGFRRLEAMVSPGAKHVLSKPEHGFQVYDIDDAGNEYVEKFL